VTDEPIVRVQDVAQRFGARTIFRDVSFTVSPGEVFVILGGSGCGKSTLMKQLIGLLTPSRGRIEIFGREITGPDGELGADLPPLDELERRYIARVLAHAGGNMTKASRILGIDRKTLYRHRDRLGQSDPVVDKWDIH